MIIKEKRDIDELSEMMSASRSRERSKDDIHERLY